MTESNVIFVPERQTRLQVQELDLEDFFSLVPDVPGVELVPFGVGEKKIFINVACGRLVLLAKNRCCKGCGIIGTRLFIDLDDSRSKLLKEPVFHVNLYAEIGSVEGSSHFVLMCKDHIKPRVKGGADDFGNFQTLCYNCNSVKSTFEITTEQLRTILFPAYRAYRSSRALRDQKKENAKLRWMIKKSESAIESIKQPFSKIQNKEAATTKIASLENRICNLRQKCFDSELEAQVTGIITPYEVLSEH